MDERTSSHDNHLSEADNASRLDELSAAAKDLELERDKLSPAEYQTRLDALLNSASDMQHTVEDRRLIDMLDKGQIQPEPKADTLASAMLETLSSSWSRKFVGDVEYVVEQGFPNCLFLDQPRLAECFSKILGVLFTATCPMKLRVRLSEPSKGRGDGASFRITVSITGPGCRGKLAAMFVHLQDSADLYNETTTAAALTLISARRLLTHIGENVRIELNENNNDNSNSDIGEFYIEFTAQAAELDLLDIQEELDVVTARQVLFIDESRYGVATKIGQTLESLDLRYETVQASSNTPVADWRFPTKAWYNCVIVESMEMAKNLREAGRFHDAPVLLFLGSEAPVDVRAAINFGISGLITMPFSATDLALLLQKYVARSIPCPIPGFTILYANSNYVNRRVISKIMNKIGQTVYTVNDGLQALEEVKRRRYDFIILSISMSVMVWTKSPQRSDARAV